MTEIANILIAIGEREMAIGILKSTYYALSRQRIDAIPTEGLQLMYECEALLNSFGIELY